MNFIKLKKSLLLFTFLISTTLWHTHTHAQLPKYFVYLHDIDPTICVSLRYASCENFIGKPICGYKKPVVIVTKQAALALKKVQAEVKKDGYSLVIYDAYRPQQAVNNFIDWSTEIKEQDKKASYYPRIDKKNVFELGYIAAKSGHSRGSTVDLTLIKTEHSLCEIITKKRILLDGFTITFLDDNTIDMGSSFDLLDGASHPENNILIEEIYKKPRAYLKEVMEKYGFKQSSKEWWHFTLINEPYPADQDSSYFNFLVE